MPFSNGTEIWAFIARFCQNGCVNYIYDPASDSWGCIITDLFFEYGYGAEGKALEMLNKLASGEFCSMYKHLREGGIEPLRRAKGQTRLDLSKQSKTEDENSA